MAVIINFNPCKIPNGIYRHHKGELYEVLGGLNNAEDDREMVVYRKLSSANSTNNPLHTRTVQNFDDILEVEGKGLVARFTRCN